MPKDPMNTSTEYNTTILNDAAVAASLTGLYYNRMQLQSTAKVEANQIQVKKKACLG
jgi:hypothetical protein